MPRKPLSLGRRILGWVNSQVGRPSASVHAAATVGRLANDWITSLLSSDQELKADIGLLRSRSRQVTRDNPYIAGVARTLINNVLGPKGVTVRPRIRRPDGKAWKEANVMLKEHWDRWCKWGNCSMDGRGSFANKQRTLLRSWFVDGEAVARRVHISGEYGMRIQLLDSDQIDHMYNVSRTPNGTQIRLGVETDMYGKIIQFHMFSGHPTDLFSLGRNTKPVPAEDIVFFYDELRSGQIRGIPMMTPAILTTKLNDEYVIATLMQARIGASAGGFFETDPNIYSPAIDAPDGTESSKSLMMNLQPGVAKQLPPGLKWVANNPSFPQNTFGDFEKVMNLGASRALGISYATYSGDLSEANYASGRRGSMGEQETWSSIQEDFANAIVFPIYRDFIKMGVLSGAIKLPAGLTVEQAQEQCTLDLRGWPWEDPLKDVSASEKELDNHLTSHTRILARQGVVFEDILDEIEEEREQMAERNIKPKVSSDATKNNTTDDKNSIVDSDEEEEDDSEEDDMKDEEKARVLKLAGGNR
jgi:lambda family phage portal protein